MTADRVEVSWDPAKSKWLVRIQSGEEVIRRYCGALKDLLICALRCATIAANHFFTALNAHQPLGFGRVPGDFHSISGHRFLQGELRYIVVQPPALMNVKSKRI